MKTRKILVAAVLAAAAISGVDAGAQSATQSGKSVAAAEMSEGEVRKIDKEQGRITLKHGEIRNLDMPPMTMVFRIKDAAMLDQLKPGDKVDFRAERIRGDLTVTGLEKK